MNNTMIEKWNKKVRNGDIVYILGDFAYAPNNEEYKELLSKLNGIKILVKGNHDKVSEVRAINLGFQCMVREAVINIGKQRVRLSHYPYKPNWFNTLKISFLQKFKLYLWDLRFMNVRPKQDKDEWLLFGHTHQTESYTGGKSIHIGVDSWDFEPVSVNKIVEIIKNNS